MRWRSIAEFNEQFCNLIVKDILGLKRCLKCESNFKNDTVIIEIEKEIDFDIPKGAERFLKDIKNTVTIKLTCDNIESVDFDITDEHRYKYKQFVVANGYSMIWKDNPYDFGSEEW